MSSSFITWPVRKRCRSLGLLLQHRINSSQFGLLPMKSPVLPSQDNSMLCCLDIWISRMLRLKTEGIFIPGRDGVQLLVRSQTAPGSFSWRRARGGHRDLSDLPKASCSGTCRSSHVTSQSEGSFGEDAGYLRDVLTEEMALPFPGARNPTGFLMRSA